MKVRNEGEGAMKKHRKIFAIILAAVLAAGLLSSCGGGGNDNGGDTGGDTENAVLNVGIDYSAYETMDVQKTTYTEVFEISDLVCETLIGKDPETLESYPLLVTEMPEVSADNLTYSFTLKDGVKFHDGTSLNSDDVIYTFQRLFAPETLCPMTWLVDMIDGATEYNAGTADSIKGIVKTDDLNFTITLKYPYSAFIATLAASPLAIISDEACEAAGDRWGIDSYVGTGPFEFTSFAPGEKIVLSRFDDYHNGAKKMSEIDIFCMDKNTALMEFEAGTIDVCTLSSELAQDYLNNDEYKDCVKYQDYFGVYTLVINQEIAPFDNPKVRQAFALAIDKDAIANDYFDGSVTAAYTFLPPGISGHDDSLADKNKRDVEKAKQLLADAGYPDGITITTYISQANDVMTLIQQQVLEANITFDIQLSDAATVSDMRTNGKLSCWLLQWYADYNDADEFLYGIFQSNVADYFSTGWRNAEFDAELDRCRALTDPDEKAEIYKKLDYEITWEQYGNVPLYYPGGYYLVSSRVKNVTQKKDFLFYFADAELA